MLIYSPPLHLSIVFTSKPQLLATISTNTFIPSPPTTQTPLDIISHVRQLIVENNAQQEARMATMFLENRQEEQTNL